jgi:putative NADH-flavin reductase
MRVIVYGARGKAGSEIAKELLRRGHEVVAVTRTPGGTPGGVTSAIDDGSDPAKIAEVVKGADAVVSAVAPPFEDTDEIIGMTDRLIEGVKLAGGKQAGPRLLIVGGAASLFITGPDGKRVTLLESGHLPAEWIPIATSHEKLLEKLRANEDVDWTYFSPAAFFEVGPRTGKFRLGKDDLVVGANGKSEISYADYAIAAVDELEKPQFRRARFTVGY